MIRNVNSIKYLFCGPLHPDATPNRERIRVLRSFGFEVVEADDTGFMRFGMITRIQKIIKGMNWEFPKRVVNSYNNYFLEMISKIRPDIVWTEKALLLSSETLKEAKQIVPESVFVSWVDDNPFGLRYKEAPIWIHFIKNISLYDLHLVKRESDILNFQRHGAKNIAVYHHGFSSFHHPYSPGEIPDHLKHEIVFIGNALDQRDRSIAYLLEKRRLPVHVYGGLWNRHRLFYSNRLNFHGSVIGSVYAQVVSGSKINLGYISRSNLDEYSHRSIDIPACEGFLLAERTPTHQEMYEEGQEAEFFASDEECADKIRYYLCHDKQRQKIASAGYHRGIRSDYSVQRSMAEAVKEIFKLRCETNNV